MLDWIAEKIHAIVSFVPALLPRILLNLSSFEQCLDYFLSSSWPGSLRCGRFVLPFGTLGVVSIRQVIAPALRCDATEIATW
jgi:hypothetical protein